MLLTALSFKEVLRLRQGLGKVFATPWVAGEGLKKRLIQSSVVNPRLVELGLDPDMELDAEVSA